MTDSPDLLRVVRHAVLTARAQPNEVPEIAPQWLEQAESALASQDHLRVHALAAELSRAHAQYRADFEVKAWLFDLRNALHAHHTSTNSPR